jgi:hypothetical protein
MIFMYGQMTKNARTRECSGRGECHFFAAFLALRFALVTFLAGVFDFATSLTGAGATAGAVCGARVGWIAGTAVCATAAVDKKKVRMSGKSLFIVNIPKN